MQTTNLRKVGGSVMLAVPPALLELLGLRPGARVGIAVERGQLVVKPEKRPSYKLDDLLAEVAPNAARKKRDRLWGAGKSAGRELI